MEKKCVLWKIVWSLLLVRVAALSDLCICVCRRRFLACTLEGFSGVFRVAKNVEDAPQTLTCKMDVAVDGIYMLGLDFGWGY